MLAFIAGFLLNKNLLGIAIKVLYYAIFISVVGLVMSSYSFLITALAQIFNVVSHFLTLVSSGSGSGGQSMAIFWGLLSAVGFTPALNASMPLIMSAISFVFVRILFVFSLSAYSKLVFFLNPLLK